ncbi:hypothetical protein ABID47_001245 [Paenibacillus favisporus]|uniref:Transposase n=1 Tax=Paenibacillus favisporus TaxID=221028 RepID=A0ABV2EYD4_9BACL
MSAIVYYRQKMEQRKIKWSRTDQAIQSGQPISEVYNLSVN